MPSSSQDDVEYLLTHSPILVIKLINIVLTVIVICIVIKIIAKKRIQYVEKISKAKQGSAEKQYHEKCSENSETLKGNPEEDFKKQEAKERKEYVISAPLNKPDLQKASVEEQSNIDSYE